MNKLLKLIIVLIASHTLAANTVVESSGSVSLLKNSLGYYVDSYSRPITQFGNQMDDISGFIYLGVEASANPSYAYDVLLRNDSADQRELWSLDASGAIVYSVYISIEQLRSYEIAFAQDLDGDSQIGTASEIEDLLTQAKADLRAGRIIEADQVLNTVLFSAPLNTEALLLKCFTETGKFIEQDLTSFLIEMGADPTRTYEALDVSTLISGSSNDEPSYPINDNYPSSANYGNYLYNWTRPVHSLTELEDGGPGESALDKLFDYTLNTQTSIPMNLDIGVFSTPQGVRKSGITFYFTGSSEEQVDFLVSFNDGGSSSPLNMYFNGIQIGEIYSGSISLDLGDSEFYLNNNGSVSVRMQPGDRVCFEVEQRIDYMGSVSQTNVSIQALDPENLGIENGILYNSYYPNLASGANLSDLSNFFIGKVGHENAAGNEEEEEEEEEHRHSAGLNTLLSSIKSHLLAVPSDGRATFLPVDTGMPVDLIIEAVDAQMLVAFVESFQAYQILGDAYDYSLDLSQANTNNLRQNLLSLDDFKRILPTFFSVREVPDTMVSEARTLILAALNRYTTNETVLWNRASESYNSYLFEIDRSQQAQSQQDWSGTVSSTINSLSSFTPAASIVTSAENTVKSGFEFTLDPLFGASAFDFKSDLLEEDLEDGDYSFYHFARENGFVQKLLPANFDGYCLARFDEQNELHEVDLIFKTDEQTWPYQGAGYSYNGGDFNPFKGQLVLAPNGTTIRYSADTTASSSYELIQLTAETEYGGAWELVEDLNSGMEDLNTEAEEDTNRGRYVIYPAVLDMDNDGTADGLQLVQGFRVLPPNSLNSNDIAQSEYGLSKAHQPQSLSGKILVADKEIIINNNNYYYLDSYPVQFLSTDILSFVNYWDTGTGGNQVANLEYEFSPRLSAFAIENDGYSAYQTTDKIVTFYKSAYEGAGFSIGNSMGFQDGSVNHFNFSLYPASLDLNKNGATDGSEISFGQDLDFDQLPREVDIVSTTNQAVDEDSDGLPDLLEARFGGSGSDPNDASVTTSYLMQNNLYTLSEAENMGVNNGINQVVQSPASYNLFSADSIKELKLSGLTVGPIYGDTVAVNYTVEESQTLGEWSTHSDGTIQIELPDDSSFIRLRVDE